MHVDLRQPMALKEQCNLSCGFATVCLKILQEQTFRLICLILKKPNGNLKVMDTNRALTYLLKATPSSISALTDFLNIWLFVLGGPLPSDVCCQGQKREGWGGGRGGGGDTHQPTKTTNSICCVSSSPPSPTCES